MGQGLPDQFIVIFLTRRPWLKRLYTQLFYSGIWLKSLHSNLYPGYRRKVGSADGEHVRG